MLASTEEKSGGQPPNPKPMAEFVEQILHANLFDVGSSGNKFTGKRRRTHERLDRVLLNLF